MSYLISKSNREKIRFPEEVKERTKKKTFSDWMNEPDPEGMTRWDALCMSLGIAFAFILAFGIPILLGII